MAIELIEPSAAFIESYQSALIEFDEQRIVGFWKLFGPIEDVAAYLQTIRSYQHISGLEKSIVPASVYWLVDGDEFVGHTSVRHVLNAALERNGGHIGYAIRPSHHRRGYGTRILELVLPRARSLGIQRALLTCNKDNVASRKIIEKHGGILIDDTNFSDGGILRFWITL